MPFMTVKLTPGVHAEQTPLLLTAGIVQSNNVRWRAGLPEKIGGWMKFYYGFGAGMVRPGTRDRCGGEGALRTACAAECRGRG